ncbi:uncharacterized protein B0T15DRAFT_177091 [Chaetomium strumarium]|uniref:Uncharacterized protein n=1 Tax=Chaetomium strumarium TaxID=1170767 RepID=A0AAJ0GWD7_9PEZI|nr:hypothetical protein B0T15DRAFT_177091 [Chaetomium strumarium]
MASGTTSMQTSAEHAHTGTALLPLTTPFFQSPECSSIWDLTSITPVTDGSSRALTVLVSDAANTGFPWCQPSGWATNAPARRFSFSPAVCPSGWTYWDMQETISFDNTAHFASLYSTALCCDSGYSPGPRKYALPTISVPCIRTFDPGDSMTITVRESHRDGPARTITEGLLMHDAWHISWRSVDTSTLSPLLPTLTSNKFLTSWVPGQTVAPGEGDRAAKASADDEAISGAKWFAFIGVPILVAAIIAGVVWCRIAGRRIKRQGVTEQEVNGSGSWM